MEEEEPLWTEFFQDKENEIILITRYISEERKNLLKMYENFRMDRRCCGLPPFGRKRIEAWIGYLEERGFNFIAKHGNAVVGHVAVVPLNDEAEFVIFVHPDYEERGIGGELMRFVENFVRYKGIEKLKAVTERENRVALNFYIHLGFEVTSTDPVYAYLEKKII
jgi:ribosomal protein S18 acetylase RimI-like enzyme